MIGLSTQFFRSSQFSVPAETPTRRLVQLCKMLEGTDYLTGASAKNYLVEEEFRREEIKVRFQDYKHPVYTQLHGDFIPYLSILDLLFNCGQESTEILTNSS